MEDGAVASNDTRSEKMGATNNNNAARKAVLQERKRQIEEALTKCNQELRQLCIQEAELTGITPPEMPLEEGETPPTIRRKVGTAYQLNENLLNNTSKDQLIADLELQIQVHMNLADAALGLSSDNLSSKTVKRQHRAEYQKHKAQVNALQEKLLLLQEKAASEQVKQKKKPRIPEPQDDNISVMTNEPYSKPDHRHSQLSSKHSLSMLSPTDTYPEARYPPGTSRQHNYRHSENVYFHYPKPDDMVTSGFYRLSLNGYNDYIERHENSLPHYYHQSQVHSYNYPYSSNSQAVHVSQHYSQQPSPVLPHGSPQMSQHSPHLSQSSQHLPHHSPHLSHHSQHSPHLPQHSPMSQHSPISQHSPQMKSHSPQLSHSPLSQHSMTMQRASQNYSRMSQQYVQFHRQSSPTTNNSVSSLSKVQYYPSHTIHGEPGYSRYTVDGSAYRNTVDVGGFRNQHPLQPHQQYEHNGMTSGLGGCWKRSETGEMFWVYSSSTLDNSWQRDKRFGSLDRRKNKRVQRRISPVENKSATLATMPAHSDQVKTAFVKPSQITNRHSQDHRQLVRTQSLGSVGQTIDSVYPSDDTSSCESDNRSLKENRTVRKQKEKEWLETSLDGPISPTHSVISRSQSTIPTALPPEEQYVVQTPPPPPPISPTIPLLIPSHPATIQHNIPQFRHKIPSPIPSPLSPKLPLEIPAESNPTHRVPEPPNMELLNNNIPKHCTIVQAGVCKPYHEETKPFEMSDFYKYSTKFKKSPQKERGLGTGLSQAPGGATSQKSLIENFEDVGNKNRYPTNQMQQHFVQLSTIREPTTPGLKPNHNIGQITVTERFSEDRNAWYDDQDHHNDNNNSGGSKNRSSATLV